MSAGDGVIAWSRLPGKRPLTFPQARGKVKRTPKGVVGLHGWSMHPQPPAHRRAAASQPLPVPCDEDMPNERRLR